MDLFEIIAMFLLSGIIATGVSLPLNHYLSKKWFLGLGILLVCAYTVLVSKQCLTTPECTLAYTRDFKAIPLFVYLGNSIIAGLYLILAFFCSCLYEKERNSDKNFRKTLCLNRWFGLIAGGFTTTLLYCITPPKNCGIFFSTTAVLAYAIFALIFAFFIPCYLLVRKK